MTDRLVAALLALVILTAVAAPATAADASVVGPTIVSDHVPDAELVGEGRLKVLVWSVYDARLYASDGRFARDAPFALTFSYLRRVDGTDIVESSMKEIAAQGGHDAASLARWQTALERIMPDVEAGTTLVGISDARGHALFFRDEEALGEVDDPAFTRAFFDIWLGEQTSRPALRERLLTGTAR